jgi:hypothetical protein
MKARLVASPFETRAKGALLRVRVWQLPRLPSNDGLAHLFRKFNGKPPRGQSMAISSPLPDSVM